MVIVKLDKFIVQITNDKVKFHKVSDLNDIVVFDRWQWDDELVRTLDVEKCAMNMWENNLLWDNEVAK